MHSNDKTELQLSVLIEELKMHVPHPDVSDLIFYQENSAEEVVDLALSYQIQKLPPPKS